MNSISEGCGSQTLSIWSGVQYLKQAFLYTDESAAHENIIFCTCMQCHSTCTCISMCSVHDHEPSVYIHVQARAKAHNRFCFLFLCRPELEIIRLGIIK